MKEVQHAIEMAALKRAETTLRARLANEPEDSGARIKLAWSLFMQALYRAGQESMLNALVSYPGEEDSVRHQRSKYVWEQDADELINDCLSQASTALHLSADPREVADANRLQSLVKMSGCEQAVMHAREESSRVLGEVLQEILSC